MFAHGPFVSRHCVICVACVKHMQVVVFQACSVQLETQPVGSWVHQISFDLPQNLHHQPCIVSEGCSCQLIDRGRR